MEAKYQVCFSSGVVGDLEALLSLLVSFGLSGIGIPVYRQIRGRQSNESIIRLGFQKNRNYCKKGGKKQYPNRRLYLAPRTENPNNKSTSGSGSDAMLIVILIGTVQLGRFVRGLLWSSEERAASEQQSSRFPVQVVRRVGSAIRSVLGGMDGGVGKMGGSVSSSASGTSGTKTM